MLLSSGRVSSVRVGSKLSSEGRRGEKAGPQVPSEDRRGWAGTGQVGEGTEACSDDKADRGGCGSGSPWGGVGSEPQRIQRHVSLCASVACAPTGEVLLWWLYSHSVWSSLWHPRSWYTLGTCPRSYPLVRASAWLPSGPPQPPMPLPPEWFPCWPQDS